MKNKIFVFFIVIVASCMFVACGSGEVGSSQDNNNKEENTMTEGKVDENNSTPNPTIEPTETPIPTPSPTPTPEPLVLGDEVMFGSFDQEYFYFEGERYGGNPEDRKYLNDGVKEELVWKVLKLSDDETKAMLITKDVIAFRPYNETLTEITWEDCSLRKWLNEDFYNGAFTDEEKAAVSESLVDNSKNEDYDTYSGEDTNDKIYCLSLKEALDFYGGKVMSYNKKLVAKDINGEASLWWLRGNCRSQRKGIWVSAAGLIDVGGTPCDGSEKAEYGLKVGVRPVMWVDVAALQK